MKHRTRKHLPSHLVLLTMGTFEPVPRPAENDEGDDDGEEVTLIVIGGPYTDRDGTEYYDCMVDSDDEGAELEEGERGMWASDDGKLERAITRSTSRLIAHGSTKLAGASMTFPKHIPRLSSK